MAALGSAILGDEGPAVVLLTGESGAGKTWLWRRWADQAPARRRFAVVEAAPGLDAVDFLNLAASAMGLDPADRLGTIRIALARALGAEAADGRSWILVVENAHHASPAVWAEVEALGGGGRPNQGFAAVLLVGRTELARRFAARPSATIAARVTTHRHLPPLDADEAAQLAAGANLDPAELDRLHRDSAGNPRRLLRLIADHRPRPRARALAPAAPRPSPSIRRAIAGDGQTIAPACPPPLVPSRPPIREEEGMIEVGWEGGLEDEAETVEVAIAAEPEARAETETETETEAASVPMGDQAIDDHYAALQAWTEWARNRDRATAESEADAEPEEEDEGEGESEGEGETGSAAELRGEPPHDDHAPFGQLFTRLRQSN